jgi:diguanylate cyclase (GGDEF)-like protein/PAS domain S-box-containing protein
VEHGLLEAIADFRVRTVPVAVGASALVIVLTVLYVLLPGHPRYPRTVLAALLAVAAVGTAAAAALPWRRPFFGAHPTRILVAFYAWSTADIALVSAGVVVSGGAVSQLYLIYLALEVFVAGVAFPRRGRVVLTVLSLAGYLSALAVDGWQVATSVLVMRLGMLIATGVAADFLAVEITRELSMRLRANAAAQQRAERWGRIADLGTRLDSIEVPEAVEGMIDALRAMAFDAVAFVPMRSSEQVGELRVEGFANLGVEREAANSVLLGLAELAAAEGQLVALQGWRAVAAHAPEFAVKGVDVLVVAPVRAEGTVRATLVAARRQPGPLEHEELAALELLAAHMGRSLENALRLERERRSSARFRSLIESAPDAMVVVDTSGTVVDANREAERLFGAEPGGLEGRAVEELVPERERRALRQLVRSVVSRPRPINLGIDTDVHARRMDGTEFQAEVVVNPIDTPDGLVLTAAVHDVTERRAMERRLAHEAAHDHLTGLPNRVCFMGELERALQRERSTGACPAVFFLDVDHFKYVNDSRGHAVGDQLVTDVAKRLALRVRPGHLLARFGGDEFAILALGVDTPEEAERYGSELLRAFDEPFVVDGVERYVTASIGVAFASASSTATDLLRESDAAMYHAKQNGRNRVALFDATLVALAEERLDLESALHRALDQEGFRIEYQPVVALATSEVVGFEALLRWQHPSRGFVPPIAFVPIAEESGVIVDIGRFVLAEAARQLADWRKRYETATVASMSVNVSSRQLEHDRLVADVATVLRETAIPPELLVLEITESIFIRDLHAAVRRLEALKGLGVRIALDDFGTGFSSLSSLSRLPIDIVKIDKSFVENLGTRYDAVVRSVVDLARAFQLDVVAEGVESEAQAARLAHLGCGYAQGYWFARPMPARRVEQTVLRTMRSRAWGSTGS